jgi:uncharacterized SAM-binding protein YcdF (DUF218 family)
MIRVSIVVMLGGIPGRSIMFVFLSKLLTPILSPLVLACGLIAIAVFSVRRRPRLARGAAAAALLILLLTSNRWLSTLLVSNLESRNIPRGPLPAAGAIVVLASDAMPAIPPQPTVWLDGAMANRLLFAAKLYREAKAPLVILSGGRLAWQRALPPISAGMAEVIEGMQVPKSAIIQEATSGNTYENTLEVKAILEARHIHRVLLVTSAMHMPRAMALFRHQGIDAIAAPCDYLSASPAEGWTNWRELVLESIPSADNLELTIRAEREFLGIAVYHVAGLL